MVIRQIIGANPVMEDVPSAQPLVMDRVLSVKTTMESTIS
jgi:hypothetical protein